MEQQFAQIFQQLATSNQQIQTILAQQGQEAQRSREESACMREDTIRYMDNQREALIQALAGRSHSSVVDVTKVGKPDSLRGTKEQIHHEWTNWSFTFIIWFYSQFSKAETMMDWAKNANETITPQLLGEQAVRANWGTDVENFNKQLHVALVSLCKDEALTLVRKCFRTSGLDAWRRLVKEYEPNTPQANLRLLRKILQSGQQTLTGLRPAIETWERDISRYQNRTGETLNDSVRRLTSQSMCPQPLQEHIGFHAARLSSYQLVKEEIDAYLDVKVAGNTHV